MVDLRQTKEWGQWLSTTGWVIEKVRASDGSYLFALIRQIPFLTVSFLKVQHFEKEIDWDSLAEVKKRHHVFWSVIEPSSEAAVNGIKKHGYHLSKEPYVPTKTRIVDLTKSDGALFSEMSENFRRVIKKGMTAKVKQILPEQFYEGWKRWAKSYILPRHQFEAMTLAFGKKVEFWAAEEGGQILSAIMLLLTEDTCFYYQTWTSETGRRNSEHVILVFETMKRAKKLKKKFYNFEGIQDKRFPIAKWDGFTEFKRRFGGYELAYPGSFSKWF